MRSEHTTSRATDADPLVRVGNHQPTAGVKPS